MTSFDRTRSSVLTNARNGDFDEFARIYAPLAYSMALRLRLDDDDAHDVMQQTMLELIKLMPGFVYDRSKGSFKGLVKKIVNHRTIDMIRRRRPHADIDDVEGIVGTDGEFDTLFEDEWFKSNLQVALDRARQQVKPTTYQSFYLCVIEGKSIDEVAHALNLSANQVSQNKRRIILRLREQLEDLLNDDE